MDGNGEVCLASKKRALGGNPVFLGCFRAMKSWEEKWGPPLQKKNFEFKLMGHSFFDVGYLSIFKGHNLQFVGILPRLGHQLPNSNHQPMPKFSVGSRFKKKPLSQ